MEDIDDWIDITDNEHYAIRISPATSLLYIRLTGLWTADVMARYEAELHRAMAQLRKHRCRMEEQRTLVDAVGYLVQPAPIATAHERIAAAQAANSRGVAVVVKGALLKLQASRIAPRYQFFDDRGKAMDWLSGMQA